MLKPAWKCHHSNRYRKQRCSVIVRSDIYPVVASYQCKFDSISLWHVYYFGPAIQDRSHQQVERLWIMKHYLITKCIAVIEGIDYKPTWIRFMLSTLIQFCCLNSFVKLPAMFLEQHNYTLYILLQRERTDKAPQ